jgi:hypothetical protein
MIARRPALSPPLVAAAKAIPANPSASNEKSAASARRCLLVVECLIAFALVLAEALPLLLVESVLIVTLFLRLDVFRVLSVAHVKRISRRARLQSCPTKGRSSVGRAAVSKTVGRGFESLRPCFPFKPNGLPSSGSAPRRPRSGSASSATSWTTRPGACLTNIPSAPRQHILGPRRPVRPPSGANSTGRKVQRPLRGHGPASRS